MAARKEAFTNPLVKHGGPLLLGSAMILSSCQDAKPVQRQNQNNPTLIKIPDTCNPATAIVSYADAPNPQYQARTSLISCPRGPYDQQGILVVQTDNKGNQRAKMIEGGYGEALFDQEALIDSKFGCDYIDVRVDGVQPRTMIPTDYSLSKR